MTPDAFRAAVEADLRQTGLPITATYREGNGYLAAFTTPDLGGAFVSYRGGPIEWQPAVNVASAMGLQRDGSERRPYGAYLRRLMLWGAAAVLAFWAICAALPGP